MYYPCIIISSDFIYSMPYSLCFPHRAKELAELNVQLRAIKVVPSLRSKLYEERMSHAVTFKSVLSFLGGGIYPKGGRRCMPRNSPGGKEMPNVSSGGPTTGLGWQPFHTQRHRTGLEPIRTTLAACKAELLSPRPLEHPFKFDFSWWVWLIHVWLGNIWPPCSHTNQRSRRQGADSLIRVEF